jgi:hypothetical protein
MDNITNSAELKKAIQQLEVEQYVCGQQLKEQLYDTYESFKAINLFKNTLKDVISSPFIIDNLIGTAMSLATGYLSNKILIGVSGKLFSKIFGSVIQSGIKKIITHKPQSIQSFGKNIIQHFLHKKQSIT